MSTSRKRSLTPQRAACSAFERLAQTVTIRDLYTPFAAKVNEMVTLRELRERLDELRAPIGAPVLVTGDNERNGVFLEGMRLLSWADDGSDDDTEQDEAVRGHVHEFFIDNLVSADVPAMHAMQLVADDNFAVVLDGVNLVGILREQEFWKPIGRVMLFALTVELEAAALSLCCDFAPQCVSTLSPERLKAAVGRAIPKFINSRRPLVPHGLEAEIVSATMFVDKGAMLRKCKLLIDYSGSEIKDIFANAERLRNACAHPDLAAEIGTPRVALREIARLATNIGYLVDSIETVRRRARRKGK